MFKSNIYIIMFLMKFKIFAVKFKYSIIVSINKMGILRNIFGWSKNNKKKSLLLVAGFIAVTTTLYNGVSQLVDANNLRKMFERGELTKYITSDGISVLGKSFDEFDRNRKDISVQGIIRGGRNDKLVLLQSQIFREIKTINASKEEMNQIKSLIELGDKVSLEKASDIAININGKLSELKFVKTDELKSLLLELRKQIIADLQKLA